MLRAAEAHGKQMFLRFGRATWLRVHLGLYGMWRFHGPGLEGIGRRTRRSPDAEEEGPPAPRGAVRLRLVAGGRVADLSGPTACAVETPIEKAAAQARLGEDPLRDDADPARAWAKLHGSRSPVGLLLMRQDIVAGIGNIYRAEVLFRARLDPFRSGREVEPARWEAMWSDLVTLMRDGVRTGRIRTVAGGTRRGRGAATYVAHRAGKPCLVCGTAVRAETMAGRVLYWCPVCQAPDAGWHRS